jgi:hypothetical protein
MWRRCSPWRSAARVWPGDCGRRQVQLNDVEDHLHHWMWIHERDIKRCRCLTLPASMRDLQKINQPLRKAAHRGMVLNYG